ncbi:MAG: cytochrome b [Cyanobacteria bacterium CAN_BIN43]|nr:cytochrome b [Cyanobacteria bacterium CAN_BIN43]
MENLTRLDTQRLKQPRKKTPAQGLWSIHWWMAAIYLLLFAGGSFMSELPREATYRGALYGLHKSLGVVTMGLLTARIFYLLLKSGKKKLAKRPLANWERVQAIALHTLLYLFMLIVPVSGWFFSNSSDREVALFGLTLPRLFPPDKALAEVGRNLHFWLSYSFLALVLLHSLDQRKFLRATWRRSLQAFQKRFIAS